MSLTFTQPAALWALLIILPVVLLPVLARGTRWRQTPPLTWWAAGLRAAISLALLLSLAGAQIVRSVSSLTVVYVLDLSDSVPAAERQRAEAFVRDGIGQMRAGDCAAVVAFGANALVERLASEGKTLPRIASVPVASRTDLASGVQLALALFPEASRKRMVILSDGLENSGRARTQAGLAAAHGVEIDYIPLNAGQEGAEAYLDSLATPANVHLGQRFDVTVVAFSSVAQAVRIQVFAGEALVKTAEANLTAGTNQVRIPLTADQPGFQRLRAELLPTSDTLPQNNTAAGFTVVQGPPRILLVEGQPGEARQLAAALAAAQIQSTTVAPGEIPPDLPTLGKYDAVFLVNVPAEALPGQAMQALPQYVRELGRGLAMIGGENSFGAGGYLRTPIEEALPVTMDVRNEEREPNLALVLAIDKSGSMGRCHCDNPNLLPGQYTRTESGLPKVDIAKAAIMQTYGVLGRLDFLGVVAFDQNAHWAVKLQQLAGAEQLQQSVSGVDANGQTNVYAGLNEAAAALQDANAKVKHIILVTDGWSASGSYDALADQMKRNGITLSVIAAGRGSAPYLQRLAEEGGGRYYPAEDIQALPKIFVKETIQAAGRYIVEEPFYPLKTANTPILENVGAAGVPGLQGYNGTTARGSARVSLVSPEGDPILAQWQYGLGRAVAWTSDLTGRWAADWVQWNDFTRFTGQMVDWLLPQPASQDLQATLAVNGDRVGIDVSAVDSAGRPWNFLQMRATLIGPDLIAQPITLTQTAAGRYAATAPAQDEGTYLVQVTALGSENQGGQAAVAQGDGAPVAATTAGFVVPYSPEYKHAGGSAGETLLRDLAQATGGSQLADPAQAWTLGGHPAQAAQPLATPLLLLAALLLPFDIAVRRLRLSRRDWAGLHAWLAERWGRIARHRSLAGAHQAGTGQEPELLGDLFAARQRGRQRASRHHPEDKP